MARINLSAEYERCRTWGHAWEDFVPFGKRPQGWGMRFSLRCIRCTTERHDLIDTLGQLSSRQYVYPDDYSLAKDETPTRAELRLDLLRKMRGSDIRKRRKATG
jgi:hypothetical protein